QLALSRLDTDHAGVPALVELLENLRWHHDARVRIAAVVEDCQDAAVLLAKVLERSEHARRNGYDIERFQVERLLQRLAPIQAKTNVQWNEHLVVRVRVHRRPDTGAERGDREMKTV